jgi:peroxiredoxin
MKARNRFAILAVAAAALAAPAVMMGAANLNTTSNTAAAALSIGDTVPNFTLVDLNDTSHTLSDYTSAGKTVVLEWYSPDCPFVRKHYRKDTGTMTKLEAQFADNDVVWLRINSAHGAHPSADLKHNREHAEKWSITSPILMDTTGTVGKKFGAKRTPDMYIIAPDQTLAYHGAIDNRSDAAAPGDDNYVENALNEMIAGQPVSKATTKPYGCSVKYD